MTVIYYLLTFAAGLLFGILVTSLAVMAGSKDKRDEQRFNDLPATTKKNDAA